MTIRPATLDGADLDAIVHHRRSIYREAGCGDEGGLDFMSCAFRDWLRRKMAEDEYFGWFAVAGDAIAAGLGVWLMDCPPGMRAAGRWRAEILNVYTEPFHRRRGMARALMRAAMEWCDGRGIAALMLHSTALGRPLYESLGFSPRNEMELIRPAARP